MNQEQYFVEAATKRAEFPFHCTRRAEALQFGLRIMSVSVSLGSVVTDVGLVVVVGGITQTSPPFPGFAVKSKSVPETSPPKPPASMYSTPCVVAGLPEAKRTLKSWGALGSA